MKLSTKIAAVVFVVAIALTVTTVASAAGYEFSNSLTIGSTGADVTALQTALVGSGYLTMPAGTNMGYFGALTKAAVVKYQIANSISGTGYVGPLTRAALNAGGTPASVALCPNGNTIASNCSLAPNAQAVPLCPNGMTLASNCSQAPSTSTTGTVVANGTDGTLNVAQSSYVSSGIQLKKGDTKDIAAVNLKASVGPVTLTRVAVHFSYRPWLVLSQITLHDSNGKVLATKALNSAADVTEITVGADYLVDFGNVNYTVNPGANIDLVVGATVLSATDKIPSTGTLPMNIAFDPIRTINGIGWTDSVGNAVLGTAGAGENSIVLSGTASQADINVRISPNTPSTRQVPVSATQTTSSVVLGTFSLKSANNSSTLNTLRVVLTGVAASSNVSNIRLMVGGTTYGGTFTNGAGAASVSNVTFSNLTIPLAQDTWQDFSIEADVNQNVTGDAGVSLYPNATDIVVTDANYNTATVNGVTAGATLTGTAATANTTTFTLNAMTVTNVTSSAVNAGNNSTQGYNLTYSFTLTNTSNNNLYVSATSTTLLDTTVSGSASLGSTSLSVIQSVSPASYGGDTVGTAEGAATGLSYVIPAGVSRTFTVFGSMASAAKGTVSIKVNGIKYGTGSLVGTASGDNAQLEITSGVTDASASTMSGNFF